MYIYRAFKTVQSILYLKKLFEPERLNSTCLQFQYLPVVFPSIVQLWFFRLSWPPDGTRPTFRPLDI